MHFFILFAVFFQLLLVSALPGYQHFAATVTAITTTGIGNSSGYGYGYGNHTNPTTVYNSTTTISVIKTITTSVSAVTISPAAANSSTTTTITTTSTSSTTSSANTQPTLPFVAIAIRPGTPIHLLPVNAADQSFWLGGHPATSCPPTVDEFGGCPSGDETAFGTCAMAVLTPGGQEIYARPNGEIGYTRAHSVYIPPGSSVCPFSYTGVPDTQLGHLSANATNAFGATGLQACHTDDGRWQVLLNLANATIPHSNETNSCIQFDALAVEYTEGYGAWQYN